MSETINKEIDHATELGRCLEALVVSKKEFLIKGDRDYILSGYWSLVFEHYKGILCLLRHSYYAPAFALLRPMVDALVLCHVGYIGSVDEVRRIREGIYKVSYEKDGIRIDNAIGATRSLMENYLKTARSLLHSFTHSGKAQLARRFEGNELGQFFSEGEIVAFIHNCTSAVFMITVLITQYFGFIEENKAAQRIWVEYGSELRSGA